ncbi:MAG: arg, partial [Deltaproteobacteria bacterium]|nr:arg [Deltaproteobacteria bacterium]
LEALSIASCRRGHVHDVMIMVDLGDLREGVWPTDVVPFVRQARQLPGIRITGLGTNLACFGAIAPSVDNMNQLLELARAIEHTCAFRFDWISAANSSGLGLIASGLMPARLNHARIGEGILLGRETVHRHPWPGTFQDAFVLHAEVLEVKTKPSRPVGELCEDAFGRLPAFEDRGAMMRALLNVGREDVDIDGLVPTDPGLAILGGSSDYLVVDVTGAAGDVRVGDELTFSLTYGALLAAMTSEYVQKRPVKQEGAPFDTPPQGGGRCR